MIEDNNYKPADLTPELVEEIKEFQIKMEQSAGKPIVVIAYEKE